MTHIGVAYFDELYERSADPWNFRTSPYERAKYEHSARILGPSGRVLEVGCSIGELTAVLAAQSQFVMGIDVSQRAIDLARTRLSGVAGVELACASFPEWAGIGPWEAVVCSEVLYYLDRSTLSEAAQRLEEALLAGSRVLLVHWRLPAPSYPHQGDEVHDLLCQQLGRWHVRDERTSHYRMDLLHA